MIRTAIRKQRKVFLGVLTILSIFAGYHILSAWMHARIPNDTTVPNWSQLAEGIRQVTDADTISGESWLISDAKATAYRLFMGLLVGIIGAIIIGLLMGCFKTIEAIFLPPLAFFAKVPPTAALGVFFVLVGTDIKMFTAMIAFGVLPTMGQSVYIAVRDVSDEFLYKAYTLGASNCEVIWTIIVRAILPKLLDAIRLAIGPAVVYLIAAEMLCSDVGFGYRIRLQARLLNMNIVYFYLVLLAAFGFGMDYGLRLIQSAFCRWYTQEGA